MPGKRLRSALLALSLGAAFWLGLFGTSPAEADEGVSGPGFRSRAPEGFTALRRDDEPTGCVAVYRRALTEKDELLLTISSVRHEEPEQAEDVLRREKALGISGANLDPALGRVRVTSAKVPGADEAYEVVTVTDDGSRRLLVARAGRQVVRLELTAPADQEAEAEPAWQAACTALRVESLSTSVPVGLWVTLGGVLALAGVLLWHRAGSRALARPPAPPSSLPLDGEGSAAPRVRGAGYSRADDGLPVFKSAAPATGPEGITLLRAAGPARNAAAALAAAAGRTPSLARTAPRVRRPPKAKA